MIDSPANIYKSLAQLKYEKAHNDRKFLEDKVASSEEFAENIVRETFTIRC